MYQPSTIAPEMLPVTSFASEVWPAASDGRLLDILCDSLPVSGGLPVWEAITGPEGDRWVTISAPWMWREGDQLMHLQQTSAGWQAIDGYGPATLGAEGTLEALVGILTL